MSAYFITGTDTEVGKTFVTCALLYAYAAQGIAALGMKPIAAGLDEQGVNEDVAHILAASSVKAAQDLVNPYAFAQPIAPHLAAHAEGKEIRFAPIHQAYASLQSQAQTVLVEGVGGFRVPLGPEGDSADLAQTLGLPVILVVGMRLGCINHALLTAEAIQSRGLILAGWVANCIDPAMLSREQNIATLRELIAAPLLGVVPYQPENNAQLAAASLRLPEQVRDLPRASSQWF